MPFASLIHPKQFVMPRTSMLQRTLVVFLALAFVVLSAQAHPDGGRNSDGARDTVKKTFKVHPGGTVYLDLDHGNIRIEVGHDDLVHIEVDRIVEARDREEAKQILTTHELDFRQSGDDVRVRSRFEKDRWTHKLWGKHAKFRTEIRVIVPERYNIDFTDGAGNITIDDVIGSVGGRTGAGNVVMGSIRGPVDITSGAGNIDIDGAVGRIEVTSGAGNITLHSIEGEIRAHTGAGNVMARISRQPDGDSSLGSGAGNVTVYLEDEVGVYVDAVASVGSANCDYPLKIHGKWMKKSFVGDVNGGGPDLTLRAGVGNVSLKKQ